MSSQWIHILQGNIFLLVVWRQVILDLMFLTFSLISFSHRKIKSKVPFFFLTPFSRNLQKFIYVDSGRGSDQISPDRPIRWILGRANPIPPLRPNSWSGSARLVRVTLQSAWIGSGSASRTDLDRVGTSWSDPDSQSFIDLDMPFMLSMTLFLLYPFYFILFQRAIPLSHYRPHVDIWVSTVFANLPDSCSSLYLLADCYLQSI